MLIGRVQDHLEAIYGLSFEERASEFVVDAEVAKALGGSGRSREELLVKEEEDGEVRMALYLDPQLLVRLQALQDAPEALLDRDLRGYCELAEGVSHFLYMAHTARLDRKVSLLELEAQAEVDKFASCLLMRWKTSEAWGSELMRRLFDDVAFNTQLSADERWRYEEANRLARNYCKGLMLWVTERRLDRLLSELRYTYRLGAEAKLRQLAR